MRLECEWEMMFMSFPQNHQFPSPNQAICQSQFHKIDPCLNPFKCQWKAEFASIHLDGLLMDELPGNIAQLYTKTSSLRRGGGKGRLPARWIGRDGYPRHWKIRIRNGYWIQHASILENPHPVAAAFGLLVGDVVAAMGIDGAVHGPE